MHHLPYAPEAASAEMIRGTIVLVSLPGVPPPHFNLVLTYLIENKQLQAFSPSQEPVNKKRNANKRISNPYFMPASEFQPLHQIMADIDERVTSIGRCIDAF